jgi:hypothetical protein
MMHRQSPPVIQERKVVVTAWEIGNHSRRLQLPWGPGSSVGLVLHHGLGYLAHQLCVQ